MTRWLSGLAREARGAHGHTGHAEGTDAAQNSGASAGGVDVAQAHEPCIRAEARMPQVYLRLERERADTMMQQLVHEEAAAQQAAGEGARRRRGSRKRNGRKVCPSP